MKIFNLSDKIIFLFLIVLSSCSLFGPKNKTNRSAFSPNAIQADQGYFTKAVLEYHLINEMVKRFGEVQSDSSSGMKVDSINIFINNPETFEPIVNCDYRIPLTLEELSSGFQYRYYLFTGESTAAMQAFGLTDITSNSNTEYLIIDYLQFKDCKCENLPTIRYAVGIRSELKISSFDAKASATGIGSLANLAAQVQLGNAEVNFSLKTIGITGKDSRLNIPQGVSFDVTTYKDFQNSIEFIKNKIDKDTTVIIHPEIIPVMDEYRPNTETSLSLMTEEIINLYKAKKKVQKDNKISPNAQNEIQNIYESEIENILEKRKTIIEINKALYSLDKYLFLLSVTSIKDKKIATRAIVQKANEYYYSNAIGGGSSGSGGSGVGVIGSGGSIGGGGFYPFYPLIDGLDKTKLKKLDDYYIVSDGITEVGFDYFLTEWELLTPTLADLDLIIKRLEDEQHINDRTLFTILEVLKSTKR